MTTRRRLLGLAVVLVLLAVGTGVAVRARSIVPASEAAPALGPLPGGYRYVSMEAGQARATVELYRQRYRATDVRVALVEAPQGIAPVGVTVVAFSLRAPADPRALAVQLERDVPLDDPQPKVIAGQPVLSHDGDVTLSSATIFVSGRLAIVSYGSTTAEVDGVLGALLASGAWRRSSAA